MMHRQDFTIAWFCVKESGSVFFRAYSLYGASADFIVTFLSDNKFAVLRFPGVLCHRLHLSVFDMIVYLSTLSR